MGTRLRQIVSETEPKSKTLGEVFPPKDGGGDLKEALSKEAEERKKNARKVLEQLEKGSSKEETESSSESHSRYGVAVK